MKVFEQNGKFNFVDENNVLVGYDSGQSCCEHASWFFSSKVEKSPLDKQEKIPKGITKYHFDPKFFERVSNPSDFNEGGMVAFRCVRPDGKKPDIYLHLFNCHNGYYGHGFKMTVDGKNLRDGCL